jgi:hypothetical protein
MSEENKSGEGQKTEGEGRSVDSSEVLKRIEQLESTNKRLLDQSKDWKSQANEFKAKLEDAERNKVEKSGDEKAQLDYERKQRERIEGENKKLKSKTLEQQIRQTVAKYAKDVHSLDDVLNQSQFKDILKAGIDPENLTIDEDAAKDYVNKVLEAKPWLKKNITQAGVDTTKPNGKNVPNSSNLSKLSSKEIADLIKQM